MTTSVVPKRFGAHHNAFGFLRLLFASLVIVSHTAEVVDGDQHRELLHRLTGTTTFGGFAVDGFFLISGYLISGSYLTSSSLGSYLRKRVARIYPAFVVASVLCLVIVAPLAGAHPPFSTPRACAAAVWRMAILARPAVMGAFAGQHYEAPYVALDGAMWTIQYEFFCYLLVILLGATRLLERPWVLVVLAALLTGAPVIVPDHLLPWTSHEQLFPGPPSALLSLPGIFIAGAAFRAAEGRIVLSDRRALAAAAGLALALASSVTNGLGLALFGGYLILWAARRAADTAVGRINDRTDISYGVYLYGWPVEQLLIRHAGSGLVPLGLATLLCSIALGYLSWIAVERPVMRWARDLGRKAGARAAARTTLGRRASGT